MIVEHQFSFIQMMKNTDRSLAEINQRLFDGTGSHKANSFFCGSGNNGGGGMVAARYLHNMGAKISMILINEVNSIKVERRIIFL